ncbi:MAG: nicotinate-nucleotide adenylyltransferase [Chloroflexota bacterium]
MSKVGVLGGSFDPVHIAHLIMAEEARVGLGLSRVIFIPAGQPYFKGGRSVASAEHRLEMVRLAVSSNPYFEASPIEVNRPGPSYTVDTLDALRRELGTGQEIYLILGWDSLAAIGNWKEPARVLELCHLVGIPRPGSLPPDLGELERAFPGSSGRITLLDRPLIGISSTDIRERIARGISIRYLVPEAVERYIVGHGLYRRER